MGLQEHGAARAWGCKSMGLQEHGGVRGELQFPPGAARAWGGKGGSALPPLVAPDIDALVRSSSSCSISW